MAQIGNEYRVCFEIREEIAHKEYSRQFLLDTDYGLKTIWCPKKLISVYRYIKENKKIWEVWMPQWLAEKAGLI